MDELRNLVRKFIIEALEGSDNSIKELTDEFILEEIYPNDYPRLSKSVKDFSEVVMKITKDVRAGKNKWNELSLVLYIPDFARDEFAKLISDIKLLFKADKPAAVISSEPVAMSDEEKSRLETALEKYPDVLMTNSQAFELINKLIDDADEGEHGIAGIKKVRRFVESSAAGWKGLINRIINVRRDSSAISHVGSDIATSFGIPLNLHDDVKNLEKIINSFIPEGSAREYEKLIQQSQVHGNTLTRPARKGEFNFDSIPFYRTRDFYLVFRDRKGKPIIDPVTGKAKGK